MECSTRWFDGKYAHTCRTEGEHDKHVCCSTFCQEVYDPDRVIGPDDYYDHTNWSPPSGGAGILIPASVPATPST